MCSCHCWFSLCLHHTYPPPRLNRANGAPVFTSGLRDQQFGCEHTGPLRHVTGFPGLGLLRVLRPIPPASASNGPSPRPAQCRPVREPVGWFPRSVSNRSTGSAPNYAPATSPRLRRRHSPWPPDRRHQPTEESPHTTIAVSVCAATRPQSARFEPLGLLRSFRTLVPHVRLSVLLAGPGPSGSTDPSRRCQGCYPPEPSVPEGSGCPQLHVPAATSTKRCPPTTARLENASWRSISPTQASSGRVAPKSPASRSGIR